MFEDWRCELQAMSFSTMSRPEIADAIADVCRLRAALDAYEARAVAAVGALGDRGAPASTVLRSAGRLSQREADKRARRAETLTQLPEAAQALSEGRLNAEHIETLGRAVEATSAKAVAGSGLIDKAARRPADLAARDAREWIRKEQTEVEVEAVQKKRRAARNLWIWENDDGMTVLHGEFDPVTGAELKLRLGAAANRLYHADGGRSAAADHRTPEQRRADVLFELVMGAVERPSAAPPVRYQIPVVATAERGRITGGHLVDGTPVPLSTVERHACGSDLFGMLFSGAGDPLWHGDRLRLASDAQWRGLVVRDGGCAICAAAPAVCEAHHVIPWLVGGPTDIDNLVLLCRHHHHLVHDDGYLLRRGADGWDLVPP